MENMQGPAMESCTEVRAVKQGSRQAENEVFLSFLETWKYVCSLCT